LEIGEKPGIFQSTYQPHSFSANCGRELFKPSKDLVRLRVCSEKKIVLDIFGCWYLTWAQPLDQWS